MVCGSHDGVEAEPDFWLKHMSRFYWTYVWDVWMDGWKIRVIRAYGWTATADIERLGQEVQGPGCDRCGCGY